MHETRVPGSRSFRYSSPSERPAWLDGFYAFYNERFGEAVAGPIASADEPEEPEVPYAIPGESGQPGVLEKECEELHTPVDSGPIDERPSNRIVLACEPPASAVGNQHLPWVEAWLEGIGEHKGTALQAPEDEAGGATPAPAQFMVQNGGTPPTSQGGAEQQLLPPPRTGFAAHFARHLRRLLSPFRRRRPKTKFVWLTLTGILLLTGPALELVRHGQLHGQTVAPAPIQHPAIRPLPKQSTTTSSISEIRLQPDTLTAVRHTSTPEMTTVTIELSGAANYRVNRLSNSDRIYIDFNGIQLLPALDGKAFVTAEPCLRKLRMASRGPHAARVTFETGEFCDYSATLSSNPSSLLLTLRPGHPSR